MIETHTTTSGSTEYRITAISGLGVFFAFLLIMFSMLVLVGTVFGIAISADFEIIGITISTLVGTGLVIFFIRLLLTKLLAQKISATLMKDGLDIRYLSKPFFDKVRNTYIHISDIKSYKINSHPAPSLTVTLRNNGRIRFAAPNFGDNSQLSMLTEAFSDMVEKREPATSVLSPITRKKTIYEGTSGIVLATFFIGATLAMLYAIIFMPQAHETKDVIFALGIMLSSTGYVLHIFNLRKKKKAGQD